MHYIYLAIAVLAEVLGTSLLKSTDGFSKPGPTVLVLFSYVTAFWMLSLVLKSISVAVVYAIWCGSGIVLIALVGWLILKQPLDAAALAGIGMILGGVLVIQLFSKSVEN